MTTHIGFLGTGLMGAPMAGNLLKAGFTLTVWNRTEAKTEPLADAGAGVADAPAGVAEGADAVVSMLESGPVVTEVLFDRGVADALAPGTLVIDMASIMVVMARVYAQQGETEWAVEILACVLADPVIDQPLIAEQAPIGEVATDVLSDLEEQLDLSRGRW